jgi:hypothetical protein
MQDVYHEDPVQEDALPEHWSKSVDKCWCDELKVHNKEDDSGFPIVS